MQNQAQDKEWMGFWFETNVANGDVLNLEGWLKMLAEWHTHHANLNQSDIYSLVKSVGKHDPEFPNFGTRREHINGEMTLGEFFDMHGMEKVMPPIKVPSK